MRKPGKKAVVITASVVIAVGTAGAALAYWTSTGSGSSSNNTTGTAEHVTIVQGSTVSAMGPGVAAQPLSGTFTTAHPAYVGQVTATVTGTSNAGCTAADFTIVQPAVTNAEITTGSTWGGGSIAFLDKSTTNQDACQGVTVTIGYTSSN